MKSPAPQPDWPRDWKAPDGLGWSRERAVRLTKGGIAMLVLAGLLVGGALAAGIGLTRKATRQENERRLLNAQGTLAEAQITRLWRTGDKNREARVAYRFAVSGRNFQGQSGAPLRTWTQMSVGDPLRVRFASSDPSVNQPADWEMETIPKWLAWLIGGMLIAPAAILAGFVRRQARLLAAGSATVGVVTSHSRADHGKTRNHFQFRLADGTVKKGHRAGSKPLPLGSTVCVLYDPDNPRRYTSYPCEMVKLAEKRCV